MIKAITATTVRHLRGSAAVETAVLLPLLILLALGATDLGRFSRAYLMVDTAARLGAQYGSSSIDHSNDSDSIRAAAVYEAEALDGFSDINPTVTVTRIVESPGDASIKVTVSYQFRTLLSYSGLPSTVTLTRTAHMRVIPVEFGDEPEDWDDPDD